MHIIPTPSIHSGKGKEIIIIQSHFPNSNSALPWFPPAVPLILPGLLACHSEHSSYTLSPHHSNIGIISHWAPISNILKKALLTRPRPLDLIIAYHKISCQRLSKQILAFQSTFFRIYGLAFNGGIKFLQTGKLEKIYHYNLGGKSEAEKAPLASSTTVCWWETIQTPLPIKVLSLLRISHSPNNHLHSAVYSVSLLIAISFF